MTGNENPFECVPPDQATLNLVIAHGGRRGENRETSKRCLRPPVACFEHAGTNMKTHVQNNNEARWQRDALIMQL